MANSFTRIVPLDTRVALVRVARWPKCASEWRGASRAKGRIEEFPHVLAEHCTPIKRAGQYEPRLLEGKRRNLEAATRRVHGTVLEPGELFSYHALVGWPTKGRGFATGLELRDGQAAEGVGGGACALSNLLYLLGLRSGMEMVERHRHKLDLFPDHGRTVPFGCGATVLFPYADLKMRNQLSVSVLIEAVVTEEDLVGRIRVREVPDVQFEIVERDHQFYRDRDAWYRENRIVRITRDLEGAILKEEEVAHNVGRCLYDPEAVE